MLLFSSSGCSKYRSCTRRSLPSETLLIMCCCCATRSDWSLSFLPFFSVSGSDAASARNSQQVSDFHAPSAWRVRGCFFSKPSFFPRSCFLVWPRLLAAWGLNSCYCVTLSHLARQTSTFWSLSSLRKRNSKCMRIGLGRTQRPLWSHPSATDLQVDHHVTVHSFWDHMAQKYSFKADKPRRNTISTVFVVCAAVFFSCFYCFHILRFHHAHG